MKFFLLFFIFFSFPCSSSRFSFSFFPPLSPSLSPTLPFSVFLFYFLPWKRGLYQIVTHLRFISILVLLTKTSLIFRFDLYLCIFFRIGSYLISTSYIKSRIFLDQLSGANLMSFLSLFILQLLFLFCLLGSIIFFFD